MYVECTFLLQIDKDQINKELELDSQPQLPLPPENLIGDVNLFMHDHLDRSVAEIEVMVALAAYRRRGLGYKALSCLMAYAVKRLGITKFFSKISETNHSSIALFKK